MRILKKITNNSGKDVKLKTFSEEYYVYFEDSWTNYFDVAKDNLYNMLPTLNGNEFALVNNIINDFELIIKACPHELPNIINQLTTGAYTNLLTLGNTRTQLGINIESAFNYKGFRSSAKASWFCEKLQIKSCLYCNAQFTLAVGKKGKAKKLLFQLDHFYNKKKYPFLSLTLGNLIPCCSTCNISKSKIDFNIVNYIHPYFEDFSSKFKFYIDEINALEYLLNKKDENLLKPKMIINDNRVLEHIKVFNLDQIYYKHTDVIEELLLKSLYYNDTKKEELKKTFVDIGINETVMDRFILGNYSLDSEINNRPLSKLSKDIGKQLKIIK